MWRCSLVSPMQAELLQASSTSHSTTIRYTLKEMMACHKSQHSVYFMFSPPPLTCQLGAEADLGRTMWAIPGLGAFGFQLQEVPGDRRIVTTTRSHSNKVVTDCVDAMQPHEVIRVGGAGNKVRIKRHTEIFFLSAWVKGSQMSFFYWSLNSQPFSIFGTALCRNGFGLLIMFSNPDL